MPRIISSKQAFLRAAAYDDGKGRVLPRSEKKPAPSTDELLVAVLGEISHAVQANAKLIAALPVGPDTGLIEHLAANQIAILSLLAEIKKANAAASASAAASAAAVTKEPTAKKWIFEVRRDNRGDMENIIATSTED